jgi:hypothetical protein
MKGSLIRAGLLLVLVLVVIWHAPRSHEVQARPADVAGLSGR